MKTRQIEIFGDTWTIEDVSLATLWRNYRAGPLHKQDANLARDDILGLCMRNERRILILRNLPPRQRKRVLYHEIGHATCPAASHTRITMLEEAIDAAIG